MTKFASNGKVEYYDYEANPIVLKPKVELPAGLTAEKVHEDYLFAITGESSMKNVQKKYKKFKSLTTVASASVEQMGQTFTIQMTSKAKSPNMSSIEIKVAEMGMVVEKAVYNNGKNFY